MILKEKEISQKKKNLVKEAQNIIKSWSLIEILTSTISKRFFGKMGLNEAIKSFLRDLGILSGINHVCLVLFNEDKTVIKDSFEWFGDSINSLIPNFNDLFKETLFWLVNQLEKRKIFQITDSSKLLERLKNSEEIAKPQYNQSLLIYPVHIKSNLVGFIGFNNFLGSKSWTEIDFSLLRLSSHMIGNVLTSKKIEELLIESEAEYRRIIENINDLIVIVNLGYKIEFINSKASYKLLKYREEDILEKSYFDFIHPDDVDSAVDTIKYGFKQGESIIELRFKHRDGHWLWFECEGQTFCDKDGKLKLLVISRDISERKLAQERYKNLFQNSPNAIILINFNGMILDSNFTTKKLFGFEKEYFIGKNITNLGTIFNFEIKSYFKKIFKASFGENFPEPIEAQIRKSDNNLIWVEIQASTMKQNIKTLIQLIFQDISEKKRVDLLEKEFKEKLEVEVRERTKELNEVLNQQKLYLDQILKSSQFKTEFMSSMSHELRTPLNAIIGFTDLLLEGVYGSLNEEQLDFIKDIKTSAEHQFDMIQHILDISKIEAGQITPNFQDFSLNYVIKQIKSSLRSLYQKKNIKFKIKGLDSEKEIYADPIRFKEILLNLVGNAIKFTIEGKITLAVQEKYDYWQFKVRDTGIGIARKDFPVIFKEFKRVDSTYVRSVPGTGLGLSLTKRLINLHGGDISFTSVLGVGTTFTFTIPKQKI